MVIVLTEALPVKNQKYNNNNNIPDSEKIVYFKYAFISQIRGFFLILFLWNVSLSQLPA